jgi:hypothetical protein
MGPARAAHRKRMKYTSKAPRDRAQIQLPFDELPTAFEAVKIPPRHCSRIETHDSEKEKFPQTIFVV